MGNGELFFGNHLIVFVYKFYQKSTYRLLTKFMEGQVLNDSLLVRCGSDHPRAQRDSIRFGKS